jgi:predicted enzyme related to lactoylglutathione lyase
MAETPMAETLHGRFAWYELMTTDPDAAEGFYTRVVGWGTQPFPGLETPYTAWTAHDQPIGGLMELPPEARAGGAPPSWMPYIAVTDVDATIEEAKALGGRPEAGPREIPHEGRFAVLSDPQGAVFAILQPSDPGRYEPETVPAPLEISWRELATTDREAATDFYSALFGWERQNASDMGEPVGLYQEFGRPGLPLGGIYRKPDDVPSPPHWLLYAKVLDIEASLAAARAGGGKVLTGPMETPGGDRIAQILDPQGAAFALHQVP